MADYRLSRSGGVIHVASGAHIPPDAANRHWREYQAWVAGGGTADPVTPVDLAAYRVRARSTVVRRAEGYMTRTWVGSAGPMLTWVFETLRAEAGLADADGDPTAGEYPFLAARAAASGTSIATEATAVLSEWTAWRTRGPTVYQAMLEGLAAVDAAGTVQAVDEAVSGVAWPDVALPSPAGASAGAPTPS